MAAVPGCRPATRKPAAATPAQVPTTLPAPLVKREPKSGRSTTATVRGTQYERGRPATRESTSASGTATARRTAWRKAGESRVRLARSVPTPSLSLSQPARQRMVGWPSMRQPGCSRSWRRRATARICPARAWRWCRQLETRGAAPWPPGPGASRSAAASTAPASFSIPGSGRSAAMASPAIRRAAARWARAASTDARAGPAASRSANLARRPNRAESSSRERRASSISPRSVCASS